MFTFFFSLKETEKAVCLFVCSFLCVCAYVLMLQGEPGSVVSGGTVPGRKGEPGFPGTPVSLFLRNQDALCLL